MQDVSHTVEASYDKVFPIESSQNDIYQYVADCIPNLLNGFNCTIFTYGQTGSGKTFTMFGDQASPAQEQQSTKGSGEVFKSRHFSKDGLKTVTESGVGAGLDAEMRKGVIPRCIGELFKSIKQ